MINKYVLIILGIIYSYCSIGQSLHEYYINEYKEITDSSHAKYKTQYEIYDTIMRRGKITTYTLQGIKLSETEYKNIDKKLEHGKHTSYYENGKIKSTYSYFDGMLHGELLCYFPGGQLKRKAVYEYNVHVHGTCYGIHGSPITCTPYKVEAEYPGGEKALYKFIHQNTRYPDIALQQGITGTVIVKLLVNNKGDVVRYEIFQSAHPILDEEALRVAKLLKKFNPGQIDGEFTNTIFLLPILFENK